MTHPAAISKTRLCRHVPVISTLLLLLQCGVAFAEVTGDGPFVGRIDYVDAVSAAIPPAVAAGARRIDVVVLPASRVAELAVNMTNGTELVAAWWRPSAARYWGFGWAAADLRLHLGQGADAVAAWRVLVPIPDRRIPWMDTSLGDVTRHGDGIAQAFAAAGYPGWEHNVSVTLTLRDLHHARALLLTGSLRNLAALAVLNCSFFGDGTLAATLSSGGLQMISARIHHIGVVSVAGCNFTNGAKLYSNFLNMDDVLIFSITRNRFTGTVNSTAAFTFGGFDNRYSVASDVHVMAVEDNTFYFDANAALGLADDDDDDDGVPRVNECCARFEPNGTANKVLKAFDWSLARLNGATLLSVSHNSVHMAHCCGGTRGLVLGSLEFNPIVRGGGSDGVARLTDLVVPDDGDEDARRVATLLVDNNTIASHAGGSGGYNSAVSVSVVRLHNASVVVRRNRIRLTSKSWNPFCIALASGSRETDSSRGRRTAVIIADNVIRAAVPPAVQLIPVHVTHGTFTGIAQLLVVRNDMKTVAGHTHGIHLDSVVFTNVSGTITIAQNTLVAASTRAQYFQTRMVYLGSCSYDNVSTLVVALNRFTTTNGTVIMIDVNNNAQGSAIPRAAISDAVVVASNTFDCTSDVLCIMTRVQTRFHRDIRLGITVFNNTGAMTAPGTRAGLYVGGALDHQTNREPSDGSSGSNNRLDVTGNTFNASGPYPGFSDWAGYKTEATIYVAAGPRGTTPEPFAVAGSNATVVVHLADNAVYLDGNATDRVVGMRIESGGQVLPMTTAIVTGNSVRYSAATFTRASAWTESSAAQPRDIAVTAGFTSPNASLLLWFRRNCRRRGEGPAATPPATGDGSMCADGAPFTNVTDETYLTPPTVDRSGGGGVPALQPVANIGCNAVVDCGGGATVLHLPAAAGPSCACQCPKSPAGTPVRQMRPRALMCEIDATRAALLEGNVAWLAPAAWLPLGSERGGGNADATPSLTLPPPSSATGTRSVPRYASPTSSAKPSMTHMEQTREASQNLPPATAVASQAASASITAWYQASTTVTGSSVNSTAVSLSVSQTRRNAASAAADDEASVASPLLESPARLAVAAAAVGAAVVALAGGDTGGEAVGALQNFLVLTQVPCLRRTVLARAGDSGLWLLAPLVLGLSGHAGRVVALLAVMSAALAANGLWALRFRGRADGKMSAAGSAARPAGARGRFPSLALRVVRLLVPGLGVAAMQGVTGARVGDDDGTSAAGRVAGAAGVAALGALLWWALRACRGARVAAPAEVEAPGGTRAAEAGAVAFGAFAPHPLGARAGRWVGPTGFWLGPAARVAAPIFGGLSPPDARDTSASAAAADANNTGDAAAAGAARCSGLPGRLWWLGPWYTVGRPTLFAALLAADVERLTGQCVCWVQLALFAALFAADAAVDVGLAPLRVRVLNALNGLVSVTSCAVAALEAYGQAGALTCAARPSGSSSSSAGGGGSEALGGTSAEGAHAGGGAEAAELAGAVAALTTVLAVPSNLAMAASVFVMAMERWRWRKAQRRRWRVAAAGAAAAATLSSGDGDNAKAAAAGRGGTAQPLLSVPVVVAPAKGRGEGGRAAAAEGNSRDVRACTTSSGDDAPCEQRSRNPLQQRGDGRSAVEL